jgi:hypothetical protein
MIKAVHKECSTVTLNMASQPHVFPVFHTSEIEPYVKNHDELFPSRKLECPGPIITVWVRNMKLQILSTSRNAAAATNTSYGGPGMIMKTLVGSPEARIDPFGVTIHQPFSDIAEFAMEASALRPWERWANIPIVNLSPWP